MEAKGLWALFWVLVVVGGAVALVLGASAGAVADTGAAIQESEERQELEDADEVHINVHLTKDETATFEVDYRYHLEDENNSEEAFEELREEIESNPESYTDAEISDWNDTRNGDDLEEEVISNENVSVEDNSAPVHIGHVKFTFEWDSFATVMVDEIEAGSELSGLTLVDDTSLQINAPDDYVLDDAQPSPDSSETDSVEWDGEETEFGDDEPRVVFIEDDGEEGTTTDDDDELPTRWLAVVAALGLLATGGAVGWWLRHGNDSSSVTDTGSVSPPPAGGAATPDDGGGPPPELLSNEERVLQLLENRGGRIKQQEVVAELEWTEAKTSQVVGSLREDDEIEVFRIGRENVLAIPDDEDGDEPL
ncbi:helix-turn-helix transcriptional regulator [Natronorubrum daqingense]|uniref:IclR helix-turn-helix domain-containing protein n=1 Tax=Natronorubrum daqingense TaxID=588898 RepID=A0A1N7FS08_9EURY|nr:hypothetical protein [Natronorubrum daqingense]APX97380.1 hypothetical protein BB347_12570 [Natronorubrum daqingense]SIS03128.1 hypothetical protein SAMN05421809_3451 [Natronorubrum daqingense]